MRWAFKAITISPNSRQRLTTSLPDSPCHGLRTVFGGQEQAHRRVHMTAAPLAERGSAPNSEARYTYKDTTFSSNWMAGTLNSGFLVGLSFPLDAARPHAFSVLLILLCMLARPPPRRGWRLNRRRRQDRPPTDSSHGGARALGTPGRPIRTCQHGGHRLATDRSIRLALWRPIPLPNRGRRSGTGAAVQPHRPQWARHRQRRPHRPADRPAKWHAPAGHDGSKMAHRCPPPRDRNHRGARRWILGTQGALPESRQPDHPAGGAPPPRI